MMTDEQIAAMIGYGSWWRLPSHDERVLVAHDNTTAGGGLVVRDMTHPKFPGIPVADQESELQELIPADHPAWASRDWGRAYVRSAWRAGAEVLRQMAEDDWKWRDSGIAEAHSLAWPRR